jgi:hypothetical protein
VQPKAWDLGLGHAADRPPVVIRTMVGAGFRAAEFIEKAIAKRGEEGYRFPADWYRTILAEVYLEILAGNERLPAPTLLKNLPIILKVFIIGPSRIRGLIGHVLNNQQFEPSGHFIGRAQLILGLLYKIKKKPALAIQHLTEAKRIFSQFGQTPILARVEKALAELGQ